MMQPVTASKTFLGNRYSSINQDAHFVQDLLIGVTGRVFCSLPLNGNDLNLPVNVNACYELSDDRRKIWSGSNLTGDSAKKAEWNQLLNTECIAHCYAILIKSITKLQSSVQLWKIHFMVGTPVPFEVMASPDAPVSAPQKIIVPSTAVRINFPFEESTPTKNLVSKITKPDGTFVASATVKIDNDNIVVEVDTPKKPGDYLLYLESNGVPVPASPVLFQVLDVSKIVTLGKQKALPVGAAASVPIEIGDLDPSQIVVSLKDPVGDLIECKLVKKGDDIYLKFTPSRPGKHV